MGITSFDHSSRRDTDSGQFTSLRILSLDETCFSQCDSDAAAYWIGFLMADGNVSSSSKDGQPMLQIELQGRDREQLEKLKAFLKAEHKILTTDRKGRKYNSFKCRSTKLVKNLEQWNIVPNKCFITEPHRDLKFNRHFWRGVIDGDGTLGVYKSKQSAGSWTEVVSLTGNKMVTESFREFCSHVLGEFVSNTVTTGNNFKVTIGSKKAYKILSCLYENCSLVLDRKLETYKKIKQSRIDRGLICQQEQI